jgi:hypothetical protein
MNWLLISSTESNAVNTREKTGLGLNYLLEFFFYRYFWSSTIGAYCDKIVNPSNAPCGPILFHGKAKYFSSYVHSLTQFTSHEGKSCGIEIYFK